MSKMTKLTPPGEKAVVGWRLKPRREAGKQIEAFVMMLCKYSCSTSLVLLVTYAAVIRSNLEPLGVCLVFFFKLDPQGGTMKTNAIKHFNALYYVWIFSVDNSVAFYIQNQMNRFTSTLLLLYLFVCVCCASRCWLLTLSRVFLKPKQHLCNVNDCLWSVALLCILPL